MANTECKINSQAGRSESSHGRICVWISCWRLKGAEYWLWLCGEGEGRLWPDKSGRCVALIPTCLPLLDEELGSVAEDV